MVWDPTRRLAMNPPADKAQYHHPVSQITVCRYTFTSYGPGNTSL